MTGTTLSSWDAVSGYALSLPDTELSTYYGAPAVKVASNGRAFVNFGREADSFVLAIDEDTKELLIETDPATFWQTPHYEGWAGLLVRFSASDPERVMEMIDRARDQAATRKLAKARTKL